jgi:hypothetical protein
MTRHDDELSFKADPQPQPQVVEPTPMQRGEEVREQNAAEITDNAVDNSHVDTAAEKQAE